MNTPRWYHFFESLEAELASFFSKKDLPMVFRRAGRRSAPTECGNPVDLLKLAGIPAVELDDEVQLGFGENNLCIASWCAGFLETACGTKIILNQDSEKTVLSKDPTDDKPISNLGFNLGGSGALPPFQLAQLHDFSVDAMLFIDNQKTIRAWNKGAEDMFGYSAAEAIGKHFDILVPEDLKVAEELNELARRTEKQGSLNNHITRRTHKEGYELIVSLSRSTVLNHRQEQVGCAVILRDITAQERTKQELANAQSLAKLGEMSAQVAHEIRNPLAGVHGALQMLKRRQADDSPELEIFDDIANEITRLDNLVTDLVRFGRPSAAQLNSVNLKDWINDWLQSMDNEAQERGFKLELGSMVEASVRIDAQLLTHVLRNLIENSVEAAPGGVCIKIYCDKEDGRVNLHIEDDGPGIPLDIQAQVLNPFFTTKTRGSGLGLAICLRNLHSLGGNLELLKPSQNTGAHICLRLPLSGGI